MIEIQAGPDHTFLSEALHLLDIESFIRFLSMVMPPPSSTLPDPQAGAGEGAGPGLPEGARGPGAEDRPSGMGASLSSPVTLRELAKMLGLGESTVSMALNGSDQIARATRERVQAKAEAVGYQRSPAYAAIGSRARWRRSVQDRVLLAYVHQHAAGGTVHADMQKELAGAQAAGARLGYRVEPFLLADGGRVRELQRILLARGCAGVIFGFMREGVEVGDGGWGRFPLVACGQPTRPLPVNTVRFNWFHSTRLALRQVWARGYRRIGCIHFWHREFLAEEDLARYGGMSAAGAELGSSGLVEIPIFNEPDCPPPWSELGSWIHHHRIEAVLAVRGGTVFGALAALGLSTPRDIGFACLLGGGPGVARLAYESTQIGEAAVVWLDHMIRNGESGRPNVPKAQVIPIPWIDAESLPPRTAAS